MAIEQLSEAEQQIIYDCLLAIMHGPFISDPEFQTRLGEDRKALAEVISAWPYVDDNDDESAASLLINNCLNEVCHGVRFSQEEWEEWIVHPKSDIELVFRKWAGLKRYD